MTNKWPQILLLSGVLILPSSFSEGSKRFKNYKENATSISTENKLFKYLVFEYHLKYKHYHNIEGKVLEIYLLKKNGRLKHKHPIIYAFDKNNNGTFERSEYLKDDVPRKPDGLNGNEKPLLKWEFNLRKYIKNE